MNEDEIEVIYSNEPKEPCWPFWGVLSEKQITGLTTNNLITFYLSYSYVDVFGRFRKIAEQCLSILKRRSLTELRSAANAIEAMIEDARNCYVEEETEEYIQRILRYDGWELGYLPEGSRGTELEVRELLDNWRPEWDDSPNLPSPDDLSRLDALLSYGEFEWNHQENSLFQLGLVEPEPVEAYAVLALMVICDAINNIQKLKVQNFPYNAKQVKELGIATIEAIEICNKVEFFKNLEQYQTEKKSEIRSTLKLEIERNQISRAKNAAKIRFENNNEARKWVQSEWQFNKVGYDGNKSEFSRAYSLLVKQKFTNKNGEPLSITDKTIREIWLRDTPNASK